MPDDFGTYDEEVRRRIGNDEDYHSSWVQPPHPFLFRAVRRKTFHYFGFPWNEWVECRNKKCTSEGCIRYRKWVKDIQGALSVCDSDSVGCLHLVEVQ